MAGTTLGTGVLPGDLPGHGDGVRPGPGDHLGDGVPLGVLARLGDLVPDGDILTALGVQVVTVRLILAPDGLETIVLLPTDPWLLRHMPEVQANRLPVHNGVSVETIVEATDKPV